MVFLQQISKSDQAQGCAKVDGLHCRLWICFWFAEELQACNHSFGGKREPGSIILSRATFQGTSRAKIKMQSTFAGFLYLIATAKKMYPNALFRKPQSELCIYTVHTPFYTRNCFLCNQVALASIPIFIGSSPFTTGQLSLGELKL